MIKTVRNVIIRLAGLFGLEVNRKRKGRKKTDLSVYHKFSERSLSGRYFYNIGAGKFQHPYWTNIDFETEHYKEVQKAPFIQYDLMELKPLPIEDNIAEIVYSSHTIEHISDAAARNVLAEAYRILKPGGGIRLTTPDAWLEYQAYERKDMTFWYWVDRYSQKGKWEHLYKIPLCDASIHQLFLHHFASQLTEIDIDDTPSKKYSDSEIQEIFSRNPEVQTLDFFTQQCKFNPDHPGNHINWWTHTKLISFLKEAGFSESYISGWRQSVFPPLRDGNYFDSTHPMISLFVEAIK